MKKRFGKTLSSLDSIDEFEEALMLAGRNDGPRLLSLWGRAGHLDGTILRAVLLGVWVGAELPEEAVPQKRWIGWFRQAGFLTDCRDVRPTKPLRIYRGCTSDRIRRMAWTSSKKLARWFVNYRYERYGKSGSKGAVFAATVAADGVLAIIRNERPGEREVVVDPTYLKAIKKIDRE